jgi:hypothetical protein
VSTTTATEPTTTTTTQAPVELPAITGLSPTSGASDGGTTVEITGTGFESVSAVTFGDEDAMYKVDSPTHITAEAPAHDLGMVEVVVWTAGGSSATEGSANDYNYGNFYLLDPGVLKLLPLMMANYYEDTDPLIQWPEWWGTFEDGGDSGGSCTYARQPTDDNPGPDPAPVSIAFSGTQLAVIARLGPDYGAATVTIDGDQQHPIIVNFYDANLQYQQTVWTTGSLADGDHVVTIDASLGTITVDALRVWGGTLK